MENQNDELADARLEREIQNAADEMDAAIDKKDGVAFNAAYRKLQDLHFKRSSEQIEKMEREQGLL